MALYFDGVYKTIIILYRLTLQQKNKSTSTVIIRKIKIVYTYSIFVII